MTASRDKFGRPIVVVTGMGVVTSLGAGKDDNWTRLTAGESGIRTITRFPTDGLKTTMAGTVDFVPVEPFSSTDLSERLADIATEEAIAQSAISAPESTTRAKLASQFNELRTQVDGIAFGRPRNDVAQRAWVRVVHATGDGEGCVWCCRRMLRTMGAGWGRGARLPIGHAQRIRWRRRALGADRCAVGAGQRGATRQRAGESSSKTGRHADAGT